jgi:DNA-binding transcriptional LysR family regulator
MNISWEDAQTFLAVAEAQSFSGAARQLGLGQPTISRRVANLEARIGCQLFWRGKRGAQLTPDGTRLQPAAEQMARWAGELGRLASGHEDRVEGTVRIAAPPAFSVEVLAPFAASVQKRYPALRLEVLSSIEHVDLSRGTADLAVRTRRPQEPELMSLMQTRVELGIFGAPSYVATLPERPRPEDLAWITWAYPYEQLPPRPFLERLIPDFTPAFASDDYLVQKAATANGIGAMILERTQLPGQTGAQLSLIETSFEPPAGSLYLVCAKSMQFVPRVRHIADFLIEHLASATTDPANALQA